MRVFQVRAYGQGFPDQYRCSALRLAVLNPRMARVRPGQAVQFNSEPPMMTSSIHHAAAMNGKASTSSGLLLKK